MSTMMSGSMLSSLPWDVVTKSKYHIRTLPKSPFIEISISLSYGRMNSSNAKEIGYSIFAAFLSCVSVLVNLRTGLAATTLLLRLELTLILRDIVLVGFSEKLIDSPAQSLVHADPIL